MYDVYILRFAARIRDKSFFFLYMHSACIMSHMSFKTFAYRPDASAVFQMADSALRRSSLGNVRCSSVILTLVMQCYVVLC